MRLHWTAARTRVVVSFMMKGVKQLIVSDGVLEDPDSHGNIE